MLRTKTSTASAAERNETTMLFDPVIMSSCLTGLVAAFTNG